MLNLSVSMLAEGVPAAHANGPVGGGAAAIADGERVNPTR